jgi:parallel beta-helix repeat protein
MKMAMRILSGLLRRVIIPVLAVTCCAVPAAAQSTRVFSNTTTGAISNATSCSTPLVRNFTVNSNFIVGSVDLGLLASHTWRNDIRLTLQSPDGTRQQIVDGNEVVFVGQNFNVRLSDNGTQLVNTENPAIDHSTGPAPPYQHNYIPNAPLSVFNGQTSAGTWRLEICDVFPTADDGTFLRADLFLTPAANASGTGATFVVANTNDSGIRSLRQAVIDANATPAEADTIAFAIPGAGPHTITLTSTLPVISDNGIVIDGITQTGSQCRNLWNGDAHILQVNLRGSSTAIDGLRLSGANQTIRGLAISRFTHGITSQASSSNAVIRCNFIGLRPDGTSDGNAQRGINVFGESVRIGGLNAGEGNVISSNTVAVLTHNGSTDTSIQGNFIGTDPTGMIARPNSTAINNFNGSATWRDITRNLISGNTSGAILLETDDSISPSTDQVRIQRNIIGFNRTLSALMRNTADGIRFPNGSISNVLIGGLASTQGNVITATDHGISLNNATNVVIRGNIIARSLRHGIRLAGVNNVTIGGDAATVGNIIGGSGWSGIYAFSGSSNITILGNQIGRVNITGGDFDNQQRGIILQDVSNLTIGNGMASGRNVIGRNGDRGIMATGTTSGVTINGNYIGTDSSGNTAVPNGWNQSVGLRDAISFEDAGNFTNISVLNNVIGGYADALVEFWRSNATGITIQGNNIGVGADGVSPIVSGNTEDLIYIGAGVAGEPRGFSNVLIGGAAPGQGNLIAFSNRSGIRLDSTGSNIQVIGNTIRNNTRNGLIVLNSTRAAIISNRIFDNGLLGIDLDDDGVTPNDAGDGDSGPNDLLNFPEIAAINIIGANQLTYNFTLDVPAAANGYRVEFFANSNADPSGFGEGERFLGHVDIVHAGGVQSYTGTLTTLEPVSIGDIISATTTRRTAGGAWDITSEFSAVVSAGGTAQLEVEMVSELFETPPENPFATPGNDILLTTTVTNTGTGPTDADSIFAVVTINPANSFLNAATPALGGIVGFSSGSALLTFDAVNDLAFSNSASAPASFAECTYVPVAGYDPDVRHVCLNPKGSLPAGLPDGAFTVQLRARIN